MTTHPLLETYLRQLRLPMFLSNYRKFAEDSAQANLSYDRFLLALAELEVAQHEKNHIQRGIKAARFPVTKELANFDFSAIPSLNKAKVLDLARGEYILRREPLLLVGQPGRRENSPGDRIGPGGLSPGPPGALLHRRPPSQRLDRIAGHASPEHVYRSGAQARPARPGRAWLHPVLAHCQMSDASVPPLTGQTVPAMCGQGVPG